MAGTSRIASLVACAALIPALAGEAGAAPPQTLVEQGRRIVAGEAGLPRCADCHGMKGEGSWSEVGGARLAAPRLAQQSAFYTVKQLEDFVAGTRPSAVMQPIAGRLNAAQREAVAAYFESVRDAPYPPQPEGDPHLVQVGGVLSAVGAGGVAACMACHEQAGTGLPPSFPVLAGQSADYTERQLRLWRDGERRNDPLNVMADISRKLDDQQMRGLALYFARVRPPSEAINRLSESKVLP